MNPPAKLSAATAAELAAWDRRYVWHPFTQMGEYEPLVIDRGEGRTLYDVQGRPYLDAVSSLWCNVHGHNHPRLNQAIIDQAGRLAHCTLLGASNPPAIELARRLVELSPTGLEHVFFSSDGASSVEAALKIAFQYWHQCPNPRPEKTCYAALADAYHGDTLGAVSVGGVDRFNALFEPLLFEVVRIPAPDMYRLPRGVAPEAALDHYLAAAERVLAQHHRRLAALVMEPLVQCAAGILVHPPGYLRGIAELCRRYDVLLIADEVAVGFGRTGTLFACEQEGVTPDLMCLAKGVTGGYLPLAATLATESVYQAFLGTYADSKSFFHGHTYGGNPLAAAVALASLDLFDEEQTLARLPEKIDCLTEHLRQIARRPHVGDVRQCGLIGGIELVRDRASAEPYDWSEKRGLDVCRQALARGVLARPLGNVLVVMPPLAITLDEIDRIMLALDESIGLATES